jgi:ABC-type multidrug transport system ATPase subunit/pSer/pThr/pTyr-binding forkhead associated (FHA) protein
LVCLHCGTPVPPNAAEPLLEAVGDTSRRYIIPVFDAPSGRGRKLTVGRMPGSDIHLSGDDQIGRRHATVWSGPGGRLMLEDAGSMNGTWVDGARVSETRHAGTAQLRNACTISFGDPARNVFRVVVPTAQSDPDTPPAEAEIAVPADASVTGPVDPAATLPAGENLTGLLIFIRRALAGRVEPASEAIVFGGQEAQSRMKAPAGRQVVGLPIAGLPADAWRIERALDGCVRLTVSDAQVRLSVNSTPVDGHADLRDGDALKLSGVSALEMIYCDPPARRAHSLLDLDLEEGCDVIVGRAPECRARLAHSTVSRQHATLRLSNGKVLVRSLAAANPTRVDGRAVPLGQTATLAPGGEIDFGVLRYRFDERPPDAPVGAPADIDLILDRVTSSIASEEGVPVVRNVSLVVERGEFAGLYGPSGCGKSTLFSLVRGATPLASGSVLLNGRRVERQRQRWSGFFSDAVRSFLGDGSESENLVLVPQFDQHFRNLTVRQTLEHYAALSLKTRPAAERERRVEETLDDIVLRHKSDTPVERLAGGECKRLSVGTRLLRRPRLILLDEPEAGLDAGTCEDLVTTLAALPRRGTTVLMITHHPGPLLRFRKVMFMIAGRLLFYGPSRDLLPYFGESELSAVFHQFERRSSQEVRAVADRAAADFERTPLFRELVGQRLG